MKIGRVLLILVNFLTFSLSIGQKEEKPDEYNRFEKTCPEFWGSIEGDFKRQAANCSYLSSNRVKTNEVSVLNSVCLLVNTMLSFICEKGGDINLVDYDMSLNFSDNASICPIKLKLDDGNRNLSRSSFVEVEKILGNQRLCLKICYDLDKIEEQCIALVKAYSYLDAWGRTFAIDKSVKSSFTVTESSINRSTSTNLLNVNLSNSEKINDENTMENFPNSYVTKEKGVSNEEKSEEKNNVLLDPKNFRKNSLEGTYNNRPEKQSSEIVKSSESVTSDKEFEIPEVHVGYKKPVIKYDEILNQNQFFPEKEYSQTEDSHFLFYFLLSSSVLIIGCLACHGKKKILAYALEGSKSRHPLRKSKGAKYKKLESNLEEAIASNETHPSASSIAY